MQALRLVPFPEGAAAEAEEERRTRLRALGSMAEEDRQVIASRYCLQLSVEETAARLLPRLRRPAPGSAQLLRLARLTRSLRSEYDALMLQMHDGMKRDADYQAGAAQTRVEFPAGATWICFTDMVAHAAMAGQHQLEQTFYLPVEAMAEPDRSPLRVLERLMRRRLL